MNNLLDEGCPILQFIAIYKENMIELSAQGVSAITHSKCGDILVIHDNLLIIDVHVSLLLLSFLIWYSFNICFY